MPTKISASGSEIALLECKIHRLSIVTGTLVEPGEEIQLSSEVGVRRLDGEHGEPVGIEMAVVINANEGKVFSIDMTARSIFSMPEGVSFDEANSFMARIAPTRSMDVIRSYLEEITMRCAFGAIPVPSIPFDIDPDDWISEK